MTTTRRTLVVVPCYNEERRFSPESFVDAVRGEPNLGFLFVDDGSRDDTLEVLKRTAREAPEQLHVLPLERNSGKAEAVRRGVLHAFELGPELIGYWDADLATPLSYVSRFAAEFDNPAIALVIGSRIRLLGRRVERSAVRHYIGRGIATLAGLALNVPIYDTQCGAKLFRASPVFREVFSRPFELNWCFDIEIFARLQGMAESGRFDVLRECVEYPLGQWVDAPGSKITPKHFPSILKELGSLFWIAHKERHGRGGG